MARILHSDRVLELGTNGSGKSTHAAYLFTRFRCQRVLVDPKREWRLAGAETVSSPVGLERAMRRSALVRYVPTRADRGEWEEVFDALWAGGSRRDVVLWNDELYSVSDSSWCPTGLRLWQTQGRSLGLGHIGCTQRPRRIARELRTEAYHVFLFSRPLLTHEDLATVAQDLGLARDELRAMLDPLDPYAYLWWDKREARMAVGPPLPAGLRAETARRAKQL